MEISITQYINELIKYLDIESNNYIINIMSSSLSESKKLSKIKRFIVSDFSYKDKYEVLLSSKNLITHLVINERANFSDNIEEVYIYGKRINGFLFFENISNEPIEEKIYTFLKGDNDVLENILHIQEYIYINLIDVYINSLKSVHINKDTYIRISNLLKGIYFIGDIHSTFNKDILKDCLSPLEISSLIGIHKNNVNKKIANDLVENVDYKIIKDRNIVLRPALYKLSNDYQKNIIKILRGVLSEEELFRALSIFNYMFNDKDIYLISDYKEININKALSRVVALSDINESTSKEVRTKIKDNTYLENKHYKKLGNLIVIDSSLIKYDNSEE